MSFVSWLGRGLALVVWQTRNSMYSAEYDDTAVAAVGVDACFPAPSIENYSCTGPIPSSMSPSYSPSSNCEGALGENWVCSNGHWLYEGELIIRSTTYGTLLFHWTHSLGENLTWWS